MIDFILIVTLCFSLLALLWGVGLLWGLVQTRVPCISTHRQRADEMIRCANIQPQHNICDLGCGTGNILFQAHKEHPKAYFTGYELSPVVCWWARLKSILLRQPIQFLRQDFFKANLSDQNIVFCYLFPKIMQRIETEIWPTLKPGAKVISHGFPFPHTKPSHTIMLGKIGIFVYER